MVTHLLLLQVTQTPLCCVDTATPAARGEFPGSDVAMLAQGFCACEAPSQVPTHGRSSAISASTGILKKLKRKSRQLWKGWDSGGISGWMNHSRSWVYFYSTTSCRRVCWHKRPQCLLAAPPGGPRHSARLWRLVYSCRGSGHWPRRNNNHSGLTRLLHILLNRKYK